MILVVVGTRPELLKMAPVVKLAKARGLPVHVHCTMQSPDLVDRGILGWDSHGVWESTDDVAALGLSPDFVVVQGDTRTAYRAAVCAYEHSIPVFHLEAGVRTYDLSAPYPEEGYRQMVSRIARWHACNTIKNAENLCADNITNTTWYGEPWGEPAYSIDRTNVRVTGSPIVESVRERAADQQLFPPGSPVPMIVTLHRRENRGHFNDILHGVVDVLPAVGPIFPCWFSHPNSWAVSENTTRLQPLPPMAPRGFAGGLSVAPVVVTDSGGVQEEANALGVPCVVARTVTDRPESLGAGGAILGGNTRESVAAAIRQALDLDRSQIDPTIFGDGKASERIVDWWGQILAT